MKGFRVWSDYWKRYAFDAELYPDGSLYAMFDDDDGVPHHENTDLVLEFDTDLKDKNDKEIYVGDIVERKRMVLAKDCAYPSWGKDHIEVRRATIVFEHGSFYGRSATSGIKANYSWDELEADFEVIGNIHENGELLKEEERATENWTEKNT